jgi:response regulator of citrate/malate metabolism
MKYKTYIVEDKEFNAVALGEELGVTQQTARNRLKIAKTINELYKPLHSTIYKTHTIENRKFTSPEVAKILKCSHSMARARLGRCNTIEKLLRPIHVCSSNINNGRIIDLTKNDDETRMRKLLMGAW